MNPEKPREPLHLKTLEAQLRNLPAPKVPDHLEARLVAAIPTGSHKVVARRPGRYWLPVSAAVAAGILLAAWASLHHHGTVRPADSGRPLLASTDDPRELIEREAASARLLAAARILDQQPGMQAAAAETYEYVARTYADTSVAKESLNRTNLHKGAIQ
jgi:hypothetical protein